MENKDTVNQEGQYGQEYLLDDREPINKVGAYVYLLLSNYNYPFCPFLF